MKPKELKKELVDIENKDVLLKILIEEGFENLLDTFQYLDKKIEQLDDEYHKGYCSALLSNLADDLFGFDLIEEFRCELPCTEEEEKNEK